jgi:hypothetical protein
MGPNAGDAWDAWRKQWERAAADWAAAWVRDPRTLEFGAALMRTHLAWRRACDAIQDALWSSIPASEKNDAGA